MQVLCARDHHHQRAPSGRTDATCRTSWRDSNTVANHGWCQATAHHVQVTAGTVYRAPYVAIIPLCFLALAVGLGVWAVLDSSEEQTVQHK